MICKPRSRIYYEEALCFYRCCRCFGKAKTQDDDEDDSYAKLLNGKYDDYLVDDGKTVICCYHRPVRVGANILCYGKRVSYWPWQCLIGPDWPCSMFTYVAIIAVHAFVLGITSIHLGWPVLLVGSMGGCGLLYVYSMVACSNPGMVLKPISEVYAGDVENDVESGNGNDEREDKVVTTVSAPNVEASLGGIENGNASTRTIDNNIITNGVELMNMVPANRSNDSDSGSSEGAGTRQLLPNKAKPSATNNANIEANENANANESGVVDVEKGVKKSGKALGVVQRAGSVPPPARSDTIPCGQCKIDRPRTARHCPYCGTCINDLDHHCPWSGRCIGENNMRAFHIFVGWLCFEIYFMLGIFIYFCISYWADRSLDAGAKY